MITLCDDDGEATLDLPRVDDLIDAENAAYRLFEGIRAIIGPEGIAGVSNRSPGVFAVEWYGGPAQWADAYAVSDGVESWAFTTYAEHGVVVVFENTD